MVPLVCFHVLADPDGKPAALQFAAAVVPDADALASFLAGEAVAGLPALLPVVYGAELAVLAPALDAAGMRALAPGELADAPAGFERAKLAPGTALVRGDWYLAPPPKAQGTQGASRALALQLVQLVANDADTHEIEALLRHDPTLSYHLLKLVNSLGMGQSRRVTSFAQAILILGRAQLLRWLNLMLFAARQTDPRGPMLFARVAVRARALELLARAAGLDKNSQEQAFMVGMFSLIGVLFGMPLPEVLAPLAIADSVRAALLDHAGEVGAILRVVEAAEQGGFADLAARLAALRIDPADCNDALAQATLWMAATLRETQGGGHG